jgi:hypothetical protein
MRDISHLETWFSLVFWHGDIWQATTKHNFHRPPVSCDCWGFDRATAKLFKKIGSMLAHQLKRLYNSAGPGNLPTKGWPALRFQILEMACAQRLAMAGELKQVVISPAL